MKLVQDCMCHWLFYFVRSCVCDVPVLLGDWRLDCYSDWVWVSDVVVAVSPTAIASVIDLMTCSSYYCHLCYCCYCCRCLHSMNILQGLPLLTTTLYCYPNWVNYAGAVYQIFFIYIYGGDAGRTTAEDRLFGRLPFRLCKVYTCLFCFFSDT